MRGEQIGIVLKKNFMSSQSLSWFDPTYKELRTKVLSYSKLREGLKLSTYNSLTVLDFFHDVVEQSMRVVDITSTDKLSFTKVFWTTFKLQKMKAFSKKDPRSKSLLSFDDKYDLVDDSFVDIDAQILLSKVSPQKYQVISSFILGNSLAEISRELGVSRSAISQKYKKELVKIRGDFSIKN
jgi:hypothetical protein